MASDFNRQQLEQAYDLIQEDRHDDAIRFIRRVLENEETNSAQDNANAWWLMANAVEDPSEARRALINVLKYDPQNTMARQTLDELNDQFPPSDEELTMLLELERTSDFDIADLSAPLSDEELAELFAEDADIDLSAFESEEEEEEYDPFAELLESSPSETEAKTKKESRPEKKRRGMLGPVAVILSAVVIATLLFFIASNNANNTTESSGNPDLTQLVAQSIDNNGEMTQLVSDIQADAQQTVGDAAVFIAEQQGNQALFIQTCICVRRDCQGKSSRELFDVVTESFLTIAERVESYPSNLITTAGVDVTICQTSDHVYRATTSVENIIAYLNTNDLEAFRATWTVVEG
ncbi:MAG: hypothetical protein CUN55_08620 [Phototrophicales bacterium]|nr:MAG: hypothetical protein CUN55_08620 [Phototrophicales bacterium]